ncbi:TolC family outer membrane protein [Bordetella petrii]|uniref:TolC family outer membrane protein n=1 Tax=Bordetella petrii TaxID=94624 RepID=UPI001F60A328|nr:TolC family outer membrane protein [Bordetella petrii]
MRGRAAASAWWRAMRVLALAGACAWPDGARAQALGFRQVYDMAAAADPTWLAAQARERADSEERSLGRSGLLPNLSYRYTRARNWSQARQQTVLGTSTQDYRYSSYASGFTLSQPLFDAAAFAQYREGQARADAAGLTLERAHQALAVRVLQAYTDVLYADDALALARAQERALHEDARRAARFVAGGEGTRTDQVEVEARARIVQAQTIEAQDLARDARNALRAIAGPAMGGAPLAPLHAAGLDVLRDDARDLAAWRALALTRNPELAAQRQLVEASRQRYRAARAGHYPTVRLYARQQLTDSNAENQIGQRYDTSTVGIELSIPLYSGGHTSAASAQALAQQEEAAHELQASTWAMLDDLERQYYTVSSSRRRIAAYRQAAEAAAERVHATRRSVEGGERTSLDVLDAQRQQYESLRDLARARYDYLLAWLTLRWQAGVLSQDDVVRVGTLFADAPPARSLRDPAGRHQNIHGQK